MFIQEVARIVSHSYRLIILFLASLIFSGVIHSAWPGLMVEAGLAQSLPSLLSSQPAVQQTVQQVVQPTVQQVVQQGIDFYQKGDFAAAVERWQQALHQTQDAAERATIASNLAQAYRQMGQMDQAIAQWDQVIQFERSHLSDPDYADSQLRFGQSRFSQSLIEQAQAYGDLGQHRRAIAQLQCVLGERITQEASQTLDCGLQGGTQQSAQIRFAAEGALGNAYAAVGDYEQALTAYQASLTLAQSIDTPEMLSTAWNNLGNLYLKQAERYQFEAAAAELEEEPGFAKQRRQAATEALREAQDAYQQSWQVSQPIGGLTEATALLNLNRSLVRSTPPDTQQISSQRQRIEQLLTAAPDSRQKAYALINLPMQLTPLRDQEQARESIAAPNWQHSQDLLGQAVQVARSIGDQRAESFALGSLGRLAEAAQQDETALQWTRQAALVAQQVNAPESLYRWQWQTGRLLNRMGNREAAIQAYEQSIATLEGIRGDIASANQDLQFNFRDSVEPVYRGLMQLLLESPDAANSTVLTAAHQPVRKVLQTLEQLKLAELQNFFGDECVQVARQRMEQEAGQLTDTQAAILYSVVLPDRVEMILRTPDETLRHYPIRQSDGSLMAAAQFRQEIDALRQLLEKRTTDEYLAQAKRVYDFLIRPLAADLQAAQPRTLVLVNDDVLRNVPLAALYDGDRFLVEQYAIATTPGLSLTTSTPMRRNHLKALMVGLTNAAPPFFPLPNVQAEVDEVQKTIGGTELLDRDFTVDKMQAQLKQQYYPIVHIATHGRFGVDAASTFLLAYNNTRLGIDAIDHLLQSNVRSVELLTLSACQTAAGDNRTTLGIAGVAVRAGVKSALATLWFINDEATVPLIQSFYKHLRDPALTKAEALQEAQREMLRDAEHLQYRHPAVWAPFILVGNWL